MSEERKKLISWEEVEQSGFRVSMMMRVLGTAAAAVVAAAGELEEEEVVVAAVIISRVSSGMGLFHAFINFPVSGRERGGLSVE